MKRPSLTRPVRDLIRDLATRLPEFSHLQPDRILVVAGEARRASHATIRPLHYPRTHSRVSRDGKRAKPLVHIQGKKQLYVITLRPIWFRESTAEERVATLVHELFHISRRFDGTLHPGRRHAVMGPRFYRVLGPLVRRYLALAPPKVLAPFRRMGWVRVRHWLERPPPSYPLPSRSDRRRVYTQAQLFLGLCYMAGTPTAP